MSGTLESTWMQKIGWEWSGSSQDAPGRLFLMGNGPSLRNTPLGLLIGEQTWATSRIHLLYDRTHWRPTRYWVGEHPSHPQYKEDFFYHLDQGYEVWVRRDLIWPGGPYNGVRADRVVPWSACVGGHTGALKYLPNGELNHRFPTSWHIGPDDKWLCKAGPTFNVMLQQAYHEGWNPIYLLGCDLGYKPTSTSLDPNHFHDGYAISDYDEARARNEEETQILMHEQAFEMFTEKGVKVYNATHGGILDIYPRVDLQSVLGGGDRKRAEPGDMAAGPVTH